MGRYKTISDAEILRVARDVFRDKGHTASTREIAHAAGISEAVLYQRFGSKDHLFFAAMHAEPPDVEELFGPADPPDDARAYLRTAVVRLGRFFAEVIPLALHVMMHPAAEPAMPAHAPSTRPATHLQEGLAQRLASLMARKRIATPSAAVTAQILVSLAHDWALRAALASESPRRRERELKAMVDVICEWLRARGPA